MDQNIDHQKHQLRRAMKQLRNTIHLTEKEKRSLHICQQLKKRKEFQTKQTIAGYMPVHSEVDISPFLQSMKEEGHRIALPRVSQDLFEYYKVTDWDALEKGTFEILEPPDSAQKIKFTDLSIILVPGLAFDALGNRLGYGKGYYDRVLSQLPRYITTLGVCFEEQMLEHVPHDESDIAVQEVIFS